MSGFLLVIPTPCLLSFPTACLTRFWEPKSILPALSSVSANLIMWHHSSVSCWLYVHTRIGYTVASLSYHCLHGLAPWHLRLSPFQPCRSFQSSHAHFQYVPYITREKSSCRYFFFLWLQCLECSATITLHSLPFMISSLRTTFSGNVLSSRWLSLPSFHTFPLMCAFFFNVPCVNVCVCEREREREKERDTLFSHTFGVLSAIGLEIWVSKSDFRFLLEMMLASDCRK